VHAPPTAAINADHPAARIRLARFMGAATTAHRGVARRLGTYMDRGIIYTEYDVEIAGGESVPLRVMGGSVGDIAQHAGHDVPPADNTELVVVPREDGRVAWARLSGDRIHGGWLVDGPAIKDAWRRLADPRTLNATPSGIVNIN
jgi:hypothetical protein